VGQNKSVIIYNKANGYIVDALLKAVFNNSHCMDAVHQTYIVCGKMDLRRSIDDLVARRTRTICIRDIQSGFISVLWYPQRPIQRSILE